MEKEKLICGHNCDCKTGDDCSGEMAFNLIEIHDSPKSWKEDYQHENGQYMNSCAECFSLFMGHKRRAFCKECG